MTTTAARTTTAAATADIDVMKKKVNLQSILMVCVFLGGSFLGGFLMGTLLDSPEIQAMPPEEYFGLLALILLSLGLWFLLHIIIHEAGHLVFGLLTGYKFSSFRILNIMILKENGRLRLKKYHIPGTGGQCLLTPPELVEGRMPYVLYNLGGCLMNVAVSLGCLLVNLAFPHFWWGIGAAIGAVTAATNGIPMNMGGVTNDGHNALSLGKDPAALRGFWAQMKINEALAQGIRVKDMPDAWFDLPDDEGMRNPMAAALGYAACCRYIDEHRFGDATALIDRYLSTDNGLLGLHKDLLICERIYCELIGDGSGEVINKLLTDKLRQTMKAMKTNLTVVRTEYTLALLWDKDTAKAQKCLEVFEKNAKTYPYHCEVTGERELLALAEAKNEI